MNKHLISPALQLRNVLNDLSNADAGITGGAIVTKDGLNLVTSLPHCVDEAWSAAASAALLRLSHEASQRVLDGPIQQVLVRSEQGWLITAPCNDQAVLSVTTSVDSQLGVVFQQIENSVKKIAKLLKETGSTPDTLGCCLAH